MHCSLCPVACGADRETTAGVCGTKGLVISKYYLHPYEEPPVSYKNGSGTVFFCGCSLRCVFCQNYELSRASRGKSVTPRELADIFLQLEEAGAENINLVTPDHVSHLIAEALALRKPAVPVVYNTGGYCTLPALKAVDPYVDVYLPDLKFCSPLLSERYTGKRDYFEYASRAIEFMAKKSPVWDGDKILRGLIVRHLVMPSATSDSLKILDFLEKTVPKNTPLSLMRQYTPMGDIQAFPELNRRVTAREYRRVVDHAAALGFETIYTQEKDSAQTQFIPQWDF